MKISIILVACLGLVAAQSFSHQTSKIADKEFLLKQKFVLEILHHIHEPLTNEEFVKVSQKFVEGKEHYTHFTEVEQFFQTFELGHYLPRGQIFSVFNEEHLEEVKYLFNLFYYSHNWETFYKNVVWARVHINEGMFVYALTIAVLHREDTRGIVLPAIYEICPYMFHSGDVINAAHEFRTKYYQTPKEMLKKEYPISLWEQNWYYDDETSKVDPFFKNYDIWYTWSNYSQEYYSMNDESKLSYFNEDLGWNSYYYYYNMDYPFWMDGEKFNLDKDHRGELFMHMHQQILARYYLERLSQHLGDIPEYSLFQPIEQGYNPHLMYYNGQGFTIRKNYYEVHNTEEFHQMQLVNDYERRIHEVIDRGFYVTRDGKKIDLTTQESFDYIGNIIQTNEDSVDSRFFGYWLYISHYLLGGAQINFANDHHIVPSVMEHFETVLRDPIFYMLYKRVAKKYSHFQNQLPSYEEEELLFDGVEIKNVDVEDIYTSFEEFDADLTNLMGNDFMFKEKDVMFTARQSRLTHKPFTVNIEVQSNKAQKVVVRTFLGPKYDEFGSYIDLDENRENFYEIDQFYFDLPTGKAQIKRNSAEFYWTVEDRTTYTELYKRVMLAIDGKGDFPLDMSEAHCGFPDRLMIPRGWTSGMPVQFFVIVSPYKEGSYKPYSTFDASFTCGVGSGTRYIDENSLGYPFDREIKNENDFMVPNMYMTDVKIIHQKLYEDFEPQHLPQYH